MCYLKIVHCRHQHPQETRTVWFWDTLKTKTKKQTHTVYLVNTEQINVQLTFLQLGYTTARLLEKTRNRGQSHILILVEFHRTDYPLKYSQKQLMMKSIWRLVWKSTLTLNLTGVISGQASELLRLFQHQQAALVSSHYVGMRFSQDTRSSRQKGGTKQVNGWLWLEMI